MEIVQESWFSTPIWYTMLDDCDNKGLEAYCNVLLNTTKSNPRSCKNGFQSEQMWLQTCKDENLIHLANKVFKLSKDICTFLNVKQEKKLVLTNFWYNVHQKGSYNAPHTHPGSFLSAVYYVKAESGSGDIIFTNPNSLICFFWSSLLEKKENETVPHGSVSYKAESGKLIIFPAWLEHEVEENKSDANRISIAFNINLQDINDQI
jgi:uncharacterized protein (TIGR02466 family)